MARFVFGMNVSLDGFVDHMAFGDGPDPVLFRHFIDLIRGLSGSIYGRTLYDLMRYWDTDDPPGPRRSRSSPPPGGPCRNGWSRPALPRSAPMPR